MNIHESYVSLETAKLLKQAGFNWEIDSLYRVYPEEPVKFEVDSKLQYNWNIHSNVISAPTLSVAQRWLREVKNMYVIPQISDYEVDGCIWEYDYRVGIHNINPIRSLDKYNSYEEALEIGINKCLTLLLENNE